MPFYAVRVGRQPGIYHTWQECKEQVHKFKRARYKSFGTHGEAEEFMKVPEQDLPRLGRPKLRIACPPSETVITENTLPNRKRAFEATDPPPLEPPVVDDETIPLDTTISICISGYCDAAHTMNPKAGIGVYFGAGDPRNLLEPIASRYKPYTDQKAGLLSAIRAIQSILAMDDSIYPPSTRVVLNSRNFYVCACANKWGREWAQGGWKKKDGSRASNEFSIRSLLQVMDDAKGRGLEIEFAYITNDSEMKEGNKEATMLARNGSELKNFDDKIIRQQMIETDITVGKQLSTHRTWAF